MKFALNSISYIIILSLFIRPVYAVDFNLDILDSEDKKNVDLSRFSRAGYIMPGKYILNVMVNDQNISASSMEVSILEKNIIQRDGEQTIPQACVTQEIINKIGLTPEVLSKVSYWNDGKCADFRYLPGVEIKPNISDGLLYINVPQAYMEYSDASWLPPSRWDDGIPGLLFDYNINGNVNKLHKGSQSQNVGYNGTVGANIGVWRIRSDYQGSINHTTGKHQASESRFMWNRLYMYRAIPQLRSKLTLGENYTNSDIFSTWKYTGISLESDDRMLPPKLRGYAPEITGIAETNARIVISQQGRILYDSTVPAGPFTIQDLDSSVRGRLDVEIIEQNGQKKTFKVDTAYVPYLTRPGQIRYKLLSGRTRYKEHRMESPVFGAVEASWGINNRWSLYGGGIVMVDYNAFALGLGRDMYEFGTLSADVTQSIARIPGHENRQGKSWRLSYSKRFDNANADITFAGYRFSDQNYMTMEQYVNARYRNDFTGREKQLYTVTLNKDLSDWAASVSLQYSYQTYWDREKSNYYTLSVNRYFDAFGLKNMALGLSATRSKYKERNNDSVFLRLTIPLQTGTFSYSGSINDKHYTNTVGYSDTFNNGLSSYSMSVGVTSGEENKSQVNTYLTHNSSLSNLTANFSAIENGYTSFGLGATGGITITGKGAAMHSGSYSGGTRLLVDTDGISGVPVDSGKVITNHWGIGVVADVGSYYRNSTSVDLNKLPDDVEATRSVVESVLTEGAIGYRKFDVLKGNRVFAVLRMGDNTYPPFGASVANAKGRELGMVADSGLAWLSGVMPGDQLTVRWNGKTQCLANIPSKHELSQQLLLPCRKVH
ncbi:fimbria/pilus outer membrane usher protein [Citrobacter braakii]|uniref:fimbria/pilus outer membrane usher protein n=1 Tax=Citrobacter braakii TaxID=57706 RepID=UPI003C2B9B33